MTLRRAYDNSLRYAKKPWLWIGIGALFGAAVGFGDPDLVNAGFANPAKTGWLLIVMGAIDGLLFWLGARLLFWIMNRFTAPLYPTASNWFVRNIRVPAGSKIEPPTGDKTRRKSE